METPPQFYKIRDLVLLPELNPRAQLCEETIIRYMESFEALPPVSIQEGSGVLVDGFHRIEAATRLGVEVIPVRMLDIPDEELHLYAGLANCGHGRAMNRAERNRFMVRLVDEYGWPLEKVARTVGISASSVSLALREHHYNQQLSERLGTEVQVINSSHVQALYRVGDGQRSRLLDAVASKTDAAGQPRPLTGAELKILVDLMEDPRMPAEELQRLYEDPLARPETPVRRRGTETAAGSERSPGVPREVERRGPLSDSAGQTVPSADLRDRLLERALDPRGARESIGSPRDQESEGWTPGEEQIESFVSRFSAREEDRASRTARSPRNDPEGAAPFGLDAPGDRGEVMSAGRAPTVALLNRPESGERRPIDALKEAESLLCDLCARIEDAELWEQVRTARDLVREAAALSGY